MFFNIGTAGNIALQDDGTGVLEVDATEKTITAKAETAGSEMVASDSHFSKQYTFTVVVSAGE